MPASSFSVHAEQTLEELMQRMEALDALSDLDMDIIDGVFTLEFEDGSQVIINRQEALEQIWLASPEGPAHYGYSEAEAAWLDDKTGEDMIQTLNRVLSQKLDQPITL